MEVEFKLIKYFENVDIFDQFTVIIFKYELNFCKK